jgi:hypothetical protein
VDHVGDQDVGMKLGVAGSRRPVSERRGHEPVCLDAFGAALPAPSTGGDLLEQPEARVDGSVVGVSNLVGSLSGSERVEERDRLRRAEGRVKAWDGRRSLESSKWLAASRTKPLKNSMEDVGVDLAT